VSIHHSIPHNKAASHKVPHAIAGAKAELKGADIAIAVPISPTTSHALVYFELALSSHSKGVLISVASLPLKAVHSASSFCLCSAKALTSSSQKASIAFSCTHFCKSVHSSLSATAFHSLSIHCHIILYPRFHGLCATHTQKSAAFCNQVSPVVSVSAFFLGVPTIHKFLANSYSLSPFHVRKLSAYFLACGFFELNLDTNSSSGIESRSLPCSYPYCL
jgi:hypothetical protein